MTDYSILAKYILEKYIGNISGKNLDDVFVDASPEEKVMIGKLAANRVEKSLSGGYQDNPETEFRSIPSINLSFLISKDNQARINIKPRGVLMYTIQPDYEKTVSYVLDYLSRKNHKVYSTLEDLAGYDISIPFPPTYRRVEISEYLGDGYSLSLNGSAGEVSLDNFLSDHMHDLYEKIATEIRICRNTKLSVSDLKSKEAFERATAPKEERVYPQWLFDVYCRVSDNHDSWAVSMQMVNRTAVQGTNIGYLPIIFDAGLTVTGNEFTCFKEIELENLMTSFKTREPIYAISENTAVSFNKESNSLITDNVPYYIQYRLKTNDELNKYATFDALLGNPIENLKQISKAMHADYGKCKEEFNSCKNMISSEACEKYETALEDYENEISRFESGIQMIQYRDFVSKAFQFMLETFKLKLPSEYRHIEGWRLFQIVFIISMIPEVIRCEYKSDEPQIGNVTADLLYFPTGGGKTEAFLGVCVFTIFFDRLRGKNVGISAFLKYPLRLLAVQQLDRVLTVIAKANIILAKKMHGSNPFFVGFYVGKNVTPNDLRKPEEINIGQDMLNEKYRFIDTCPYCGKKLVNVHYDKERRVLRHYCDNIECECKELPLVIVDEEIYRYLPSIVICTIDKMATLGLNTNFRLFGHECG